MKEKEERQVDYVGVYGDGMKAFVGGKTINESGYFFFSEEWNAWRAGLEDAKGMYERRAGIGDGGEDYNFSY